MSVFEITKDGIYDITFTNKDIKVIGNLTNVTLNLATTTSTLKLSNACIDHLTVNSKYNSTIYIKSEENCNCSIDKLTIIEVAVLSYIPTINCVRFLGGTRFEGKAKYSISTYESNVVNSLECNSYIFKSQSPKSILIGEYIVFIDTNEMVHVDNLTIHPIDGKMESILSDIKNHILVEII